jgi:predicted nucleic acid-binding Zn ribbon protein
MTTNDKQYLPSGKYYCPHCNYEFEVFVPLTAPPTHGCGAGKRQRVLVHKGVLNNETGNSIG